MPQQCFVVLLKENKMSQLGDEPAYPIPSGGMVHNGLTKREHIAALQMQAIIICSGYNDEDLNAELALKAADALLARLTRDGSK